MGVDEALHPGAAFVVSWPDMPRIPQKLILGAAVVAGVAGLAIQFVPVKGIGVNPPERHEIAASPEVLRILRESCFDCHSNETRWPFYSRIAPGSWLMARDVNKGRSRMNFSEWGDSDEDDKNLDKENSWDQIEAGDMPPWFYLPPRPSARLDDGEKATLKAWLLAHKTDKKDEGAVPPAGAGPTGSAGAAGAPPTEAAPK